MPVRYLVEAHHPDPGVEHPLNSRGMMMYQAPAAGVEYVYLYRNIEYAKERVNRLFSNGYFVRLRRLPLTNEQIDNYGGTYD